MKILAASLIFLAAPAFAATDSSTDPSTDVMSLNYYPHTGHFDVVPSDLQTLSDNTGTSTNIGSSYNVNTSSLAAAYGLAHEMRVRLSESYLLESGSQTNAKGVSVPLADYGFSDPTVSYAWRFLDHTYSQVWTADLGAALIPSFGPKQAVTTAETGNDENGYWAGQIIPAVYWRYGLDEASLSATFTQRSSAQTNGSSATSTSTTAALSTFSFTLTDRIHLGPDWYLQLAIATTLPYTANFSYQSGTTSAVSYSAVTIPTLTAGYRVASDSVLNLSYAYRQSNNSTTTSKGTSSNGNQFETTMGLALLTQF